MGLLSSNTVLGLPTRIEAKDALRSAFLLLLALSLPCAAADRSSKVRRQFQLENPCPSTGETKGPCPGYVVDHIIPLCAGGRDELFNLAWQSVEEAKAKDRIEREACRK